MKLAHFSSPLAELLRSMQVQSVKGTIIVVSKSVRHLRRVTRQFSHDHFSLGKQTVYEFHMLGFLGFLFHGGAVVITRVTIEPAIPRAVP